MQHLTRRRFLLLSSACSLMAACAQTAPSEGSRPPRAVRVGIFGGGATLRDVEGLVQGLRELGYVDGHNLSIERRFTDARTELRAEAAAGLVQLGMDIIVAGAPPDIRILKAQTDTIPLLTTRARLEPGIIESFARPGGTVTGLTEERSASSVKRLEVLREVVPSLSHVGLLTSPGPPDEGVQDAAALWGIRTSLFRPLTPEAIEGALEAMAAAGVDAVYQTGPVFSGTEQHVVEFAAAHGLPAIYHERPYVEKGGLLYFGVNHRESYRRLAVYVDKIVRGANPGDLPIEGPTGFDFVINLKTARSLGLTIPQSVLAQATEIIQ